MTITFLSRYIEQKCYTQGGHILLDKLTHTHIYIKPKNTIQETVK